MKQKFMWVAALNDNTVITEFNPDGSENPYKTLPRQKITHFGLVQGSRSSYFIDLKNGIYHLKDHRLDKSVNIILPVGKSGVPICGEDVFHPFHHFKKAHQDIHLNGKSEGTVIDQYLLGWSAWKVLPAFGKRFVETTLYIDNVEVPIPVLKVYLRPEPNGKAIDGSPYEIVL